MYLAAAKICTRHLATELGHDYKCSKSKIACANGNWSAAYLLCVNTFLQSTCLTTLHYPDSNERGQLVSSQACSMCQGRILGDGGEIARFARKHSVGLSSSQLMHGID